MDTKLPVIGVLFFFVVIGFTIIGHSITHSRVVEACRRDGGTLYKQEEHGSSYACVCDGTIQWHATGFEDWLSK